MSKQDFYKYGESLGIKINDLQRLKILACAEQTEKLLIELEEWHHTCGDGCCYTYGTNIFINGKKIECEDGTNPEQLLTTLLNKLGYTDVVVNIKSL